MADIDIEFDDDGFEEVAAPIRVSGRSQWYPSAAFVTAAILLLVAPFLHLFSADFMSVDGWGRLSMSFGPGQGGILYGSTDGDGVFSATPVPGIVCAVTAVCCAIAAVSMSPRRRPRSGGDLGPLLAGALGLGMAMATGVMAVALVVDADGATTAGPMVYLVLAAVVACGIGIGLAWHRATRVMPAVNRVL